jgi:FAD/FMN-containing dehydrogenase
MSNREFLKKLEKEFGSDFYSVAEADLKTYGKDWTKVYEPRPLVVVFPRRTEEVARLLRLCSQEKIAVVPSGGRTGLAGGAVATNGELVLSLSRMNRMEQVDELALTMRVQAGAITQAVHEKAAEQGLTWPVDFASKGSSHIGGNIATNAGGVHVIRYGLTRQWVLGLQVVTMNGDVLELNGALEKNNTGFDLRQLFIGSEGTLGVITEATLKLTKLVPQKTVFLFAVADIGAVLRLFKQVRRGPFLVHAFEFFTDRCLRRVVAHRGLRLPFEAMPNHGVLLEIENTAETESALESWMEGLFESGLVTEGLMAQSPEQARDFWAIREDIAESLFATGLPHKNDVSLPISRLESFCGELESFFASHYPGWEVCNFGHIGDGNLHINIMKPEGLSAKDFHARTSEVDRDLFTMVRAHQGSISAEHGIGLLKKDYLSYSRSAAELALLRAIKRQLDPDGLLNPGKIFD